MMNEWLLGLSDDAIRIALSAMYSPGIRRDLEKGNPQLLIICYDNALRKQAEHLVKCDFDRVAAQLSWDAHRE